MKKILLNSLAFIFLLIVYYISRYDQFSSIDNYLIFIFFGLTFFVNMANRIKTPLEILLFLVFILFSLLSLVNTINLDKFYNFFSAALNHVLLIFILHIFFHYFNEKYLIFAYLFCVILIYLDLRFINYDFYLSQAIGRFRAVGLLDDPNRFGRVMYYGLIFSLFIYSSLLKKNIFKFFFLVILILFYVDAILLSASRSSFFVISLSFIYYIFNFRKNNLSNSKIFNVFLWFIISLVLFYSIYLFTISSSEMVIYQRFSSVETGRDIRLNVLFDSLTVFLNNPLFGVGWGNISLHSISSLNSHNDIVEVLASTGIIGFSIYIFIYFIILRKFISIYKIRNRLEKIDKINFVHVTVLLITHFIYMFGTWHIFSIYSSFVIAYIIFKLNNYRIKK